MKIKVVADLTRPLNAAIAFLAVAAGAATVERFILREEVFLASLSASLILISGNAINDVYDLEADKVNKPNRPIPRGAISRRDAALLSVFLAFCGVASAAFLNVYCLAIALFYAFAWYAYAIFLKPTGLPGNVLVSSGAGACFLFGALALDGFNLFTVILALCAFLLNFGREIVKGVEDMPGDRIRNCRTIALVHGVRAAGKAAASLYIILLPVSFLPFVLRYTGVIYLTLVSVADLIVVWAIIQIQKLSLDTASEISGCIKVSMFFGTIAFFLGALFR